MREETRRIDQFAPQRREEGGGGGSSNCSYPLSDLTPRKEEPRILGGRGTPLKRWSKLLDSPVADLHMNSWLNGDLRAIILVEVAARCKKTCGAMIRCGFVSMKDVSTALFIAPPHLHGVIAQIVLSGIKSPGGARLLRQVDEHYAYSDDQRIRFLEGAPVTLWALPGLVKSVSTDDLKRALAGALAHVNYLSVWFIFGRIAATREHEELAGKVMRVWIWALHPNADLLLQQFPLRSTTLALMLKRVRESGMLRERVKAHASFEEACWELLTQSIVAGNIETVVDLLNIGVPLRPEPNLFDLALSCSDVAIAKALYFDDAAHRTYIAGTARSRPTTAIKMLLHSALNLIHACRSRATFNFSESLGNWMKACTPCAGVAKS